MPLENDIQALTASINALTSAITAAAKAAPAPADALIEALKSGGPTPPAPVEEKKPEPAAPVKEKKKAEKPAAAPAQTPEPAPAAEEKPAATLPDLTATIQKALKPLLSQGKLKEAQAILKNEGKGASNFGTIARENQQAVLEALETLAISG